MSRLNRMTAVLARYPEFAEAKIPLQRIAEECCRRIPPSGVADERTPEDALEIACELAADLVSAETIRGKAIANYVVKSFQTIAVFGHRGRETFSRAGLASEAAEIKRLEAATLKAREEAAKRPLPDPSLPARAVASMKPRPGEDTWLKSGPVMRVLPPRRREIEADRCEPLADLMPTETVRENRDATYENEAIRKGRAS